MKKKGRPAVGEERRLTQAEIKCTGLDDGVLISTKKGIGLLMRRYTGQDIFHFYDEKHLKKSVKTLEEFWDRDTSGKCGKL